MKNASKKLSIVVPVYNEHELVSELISRFDKLLAQLKGTFKLKSDDIEVLFVNDGSTDDTLALLVSLCSNPIYSIINLSRNHGHQLAITAGMDQSAGEAVVVIDGDLQDPPEFIVNLYEKFLEGYDVVYVARGKREGETWFKLATAAIFYRLLKGMTRVSIPLDVGDFRIISRRVADVLLAMREPNRFIRGMVSWAGFKQIGIECHRAPRFAGESKYTLTKMIKFAVDGLLSFSSIPLKMASMFGFLSAVAGFLAALVVIYLRLFTDTTIQGWSSLIILMLFIGGIQLICLGMIGEYIQRINDQTKNRPLYVIEGIYSGKKK